MSTDTPRQPADPRGIRLQKVLAQAGLGSRRSTEELIDEGRVMVNGHVARLGERVNPYQDAISVDGMPVQVDDTKLTVVLYKPPGVLSAMTDDAGRPTLAPYVEKYPEHLVHVGRLDEDTEGVILLSNDGELTYRLTHPKYEIPKTYIARVEGRVTRGLGAVLEKGVMLDDGLARADKFVVRESQPKNSIVEITLHSGRNRVIRRMMEEVHHPVMELVRMKFANIEAGHLKPGQVRVIRGTELSALMHMVGM
ncbi:MAG: pseudouridine synthase [Actinomycetaceae bacterium]|nr:pseudouridine synthase [Actinomycetaceae bacterium]MDY6083188.1 pseudouridine synthase [Actinomycetaceae bacterium]